MTHPTDEQLQAWLDGETDASLSGEEMAAHVEHCARCQSVVEGTRQLGSAVRMWSEDSVPAVADDMVARILAAGKTATVTPITARKRSNRWLLGPATLAAAAAMIFALAHGPSGHSNTPTTQPTLVANPTTTIANDAGAGNTLVAQADPGGSDLGGSEVLSIEADRGQSSYSVLEIAGQREGTTVAVVWIDDKFDNASDPVQ